MIYELPVPGYQTLAIESNDQGTHFIYIGSNYVALDHDQWGRLTEIVKAFVDAELYDADAKQAQGIFRPGRGS